MAANSSSEMILRWRRSSSSMRRSRISAGPATPPGPGRPSAAAARLLTEAARRAPGADQSAPVEAWEPTAGLSRGPRPGPRTGGCRPHPRARGATTDGGCRAAPGERARRGPAGELVDLPVDHALHGRRPADELEHHRVVLSLHIDEQSSGRDHALPQSLRQADLGDPLQADLRGVPPEYPRRTTMRVVVSTKR